MKYAIFTSAGIFYCDDAPPPNYPEVTWPYDRDGIFMRHQNGIGGIMHLRMSTVVTSVDLTAKVRPDLL